VLTEVTVDLRVYSLLTVERAAAALSAQYVTALALHDETHVRVSLRPRFDALPEPEIIADFLAELTELAILDRLTAPTGDPRRLAG
jgi:hypothetical protein